MSDRINLRCDVCGEAENCDIYCKLTIDNIVEIDDLLCPVTGEEAEWYEVKGERIKELEGLLKEFADSPQCMHVPNWVVIKCENALKGGKIKINGSD